MSVKILFAILGPEMAAPILWAPRISVFFLQENLHVHKIPRFRGGILGWGGSADFIFMGAGIFSWALLSREFLSQDDGNCLRTSTLSPQLNFPKFEARKMAFWATPPGKMGPKVNENGPKSP